MRDWPRLRLGDIIELEYGKSLPVPDRCKGIVPVYGSNGPTGWHNEALIEGPAIIVGRKGSIGKVHYVPEPSFPIDTTYFVKIKDPNVLDLRFAYYLLAASRITELNSATGVPGLNREHAYKEPAILPPLDDSGRLWGFWTGRRRSGAAPTPPAPRPAPSSPPSSSTPSATPQQIPRGGRPIILVRALNLLILVFLQRFLEVQSRHQKKSL